MLPFSQVDVFTSELTAGNPVAVVHGADELSDEQMQALASWTNLSETTFLLRPTDPTADYRLRIFTPSRELPFAGHPTLGSARAWLEAGGTPRGEHLVQECGAGPVTIRQDGARLAFVAPPLLRGGPLSETERAAVAEAAGVGLDDVVDAQWVDNGPGWVALLLRDADAVLAVELADMDLSEFTDVGLVGPQPEGSETAFEVRAFFDGASGGSEDPVTGSLNAALGQWLIGTGRAPSSYVAAQGTRLGRRGRVHLQQDGDTLWVGGDTVIGVRGTLDLSGVRE